MGGILYQRYFIISQILSSKFLSNRKSHISMIAKDKFDKSTYDDDDHHVAEV